MLFMKNLIWLLALILASALIWNKLKHSAVVKQTQEAPVKYVKSLQQDVRKAEEVRDKANEIIRHGSQEIGKVVKDAENP